MEITFRGENMKQYLLTGESAKKFTEIKNHNEGKLKERIDNMRINLKNGTFVEMNDDGFWSGYDNMMGEISAEQLITQILEVGVLGSSHENNNAKIKVSREVARFIDDYARNMTHNENWKDKLLMDHSITYSRGFDGYSEKVKVLKDITPMKLAEILHKGYEVEYKYHKDNIPRYLKVKHRTMGDLYNIVICENDAFVEYKDYTNTSYSTKYTLEQFLDFLNEGKWIIIEE